MIREVKDNDMSEINASAAAVVDFNATWCGPCRLLGPVLSDLSEEMAGKVDFYGVDVDENAQLAGQFGIQSVPTVLLFKNGKQVSMNIGFRPKAEYKAWIENNL